MESRIFKKNGYTIKLNRDYGEPDEIFAERGNFIVSQTPKNEEEYKEAVRLSRIYRNNKHDGASYQTKLMSRLEEMENKIYDA